ncbi:MAG: alkaline phosphatase family protein, partial [Desulforhabdus sp.]|nr:alkaline phosphatase family protein [Desulforhabdus sp.]
MRKLFILGVDGATFDLLKPWTIQDHLPGFAKLLNEGCHAVLKSSIPPLSPIAWTSIATGVNPGKHGIYDFLLKKTTNDSEQPYFTFATGGDRKTKAFWEILSEAGKSCIVVNMPCSYPPDPINGIMISGWDAARDKAKAFHPKQLYQEITKEFGEYYMVPIDILSKREMASKDVQSNQRLHEALLKMTRLRRRVLGYLAKKYPWDIYFGVFYETDIAQHRFWSTLAKGAEADSPIFHVYQEIDFFIQDLLRDFGDEIDIMLVSDHGFKPLLTGIDLNSYLDQQGFLRRKISIKGKLIFVLLRHFKSLRRTLKSVGRSSWLPERISNMKPRHMNIDFENSDVFFEGMYPYFHVLDKGKDRDIIPKLLQSLAKLEYKGQKVFKKILPKHDVFWGPYVDQVPEIIGILNDHFEVAGAEVFMSKLGSKDNVFLDHVWEGNHSENGVFIFRGNEARREQMETINVFDIAPTILAYYDLPIPTEMDGLPIQDVLGNREVTYSDYNIYKDESVAGTL